MFRPIAVNVGLRYARSRRSFVSFVSVLALVGLALSVAVLVFVQGVAEGFDRELDTRILRLTPHVTATAREPDEAVPAALAAVRAVAGVRGAAAVVSGVALAAAGERVAGVLLTGVEPDEYRTVSQVFEHVEGDAGLAAGSFRVVLGGLLAERLGVGLGDSVSLAATQGSLSPLGAFPRQKRFVVTGLAHTASQLDATLAVAHRADVAALFRTNAAGTSLEISLEQPLIVHEALGDIARALNTGHFSLRVWTQSFGPLHRAIATTKQMLFLLLSLLVAVAAFNLVSSLVMVVNERRGDVAVLRTVGGRTGQVVTAFSGTRRLGGAGRHCPGRGCWRCTRLWRRGRLSPARSRARHALDGGVPRHRTARGLRRLGHPAGRCHRLRAVSDRLRVPGLAGVEAEPGGRASA